MAQTAQKIKVGLDEARILVLGTQVLVGLDFRTFFEGRFADLGFADQATKLVGLGLFLLCLALMMAAAARHRIVERGELTPGLLGFVTRAMGVALFPFAVAMGLDVYLAVKAVAPARTSALVGAATALTGLFFWYALGVLRRRRARPPAEASDMRQDEKRPDPKDELEDKINLALTEVRVVLPGAQALLGFQAAIMFTDAFARLPEASKYAHLVSFLLSILTVILLMTPAAYHRIAERGGYSQHLNRFVSRMLIGAMVALGLGMSVDFYVVVVKVTRSHAVSVATAGGLLAVFYGLWFGYGLWLRVRRRREGKRRAAAAIVGE